MTRITVAGVVRDRQGNEGAWSASADITMPTSALIGSSKPVVPFPITVPTMGSFRHYFQGNDWDGTKQPRYGVGDDLALKTAYDQWGVRDVSISFKPGYTAAKVRTFLASCPPDLRLWVTHGHEHDMDLANGDFTYQSWYDSNLMLADLAHEAGHLFGPIHNGSTRKDGAPSSDNTKPWGYWPDVWAKWEAPLAVCDFWGFDTYAETYQAPMPRLQPVLDYAAQIGLPLLIGETAAPNTDQTRQATYAAAIRAWALEHTELACWWQNQFTNKPPYPMAAPAARAWFNL